MFWTWRHLWSMPMLPMLRLRYFLLTFCCISVKGHAITGFNYSDQPAKADIQGWIIFSFLNLYVVLPCANFPCKSFCFSLCEQWSNIMCSVHICAILNCRSPSRSTSSRWGRCRQDLRRSRGPRRLPTMLSSTMREELMPTRYISYCSHRERCRRGWRGVQVQGDCPWCSHQQLEKGSC